MNLAVSLQHRLDALRKQCSTGYGCGSACISLRKECRTSPRSSTGKDRMKRLLALAGGGASDQRGIAPVRGKEAAQLAGSIATRRGQQAAQMRGARAQQKPAEGQTLDQEISRLQKLQKAHEENANRSGRHPGTVAREVIAGLQALNNSSAYGSKKPGKPLRWNIHGKNHEIPESKLQGLSPRQVSALIYTKVTGHKPGPGQGFGDWFAVPSTGKSQAAAKPPVLTNPGRQDPGLAPKAKEQGLNAQDVTTSKQQAAFARQQQQAAKAAGDQSGAQAWQKEERTVERNRLATAMNSSKQSQSSLFGVTEYDETMPLFKEQPASTPSTGGSLAVQSGGGAAARPTAAPAAKPGSIAGALRQSMEAMKAADIRQMGMIAEQLFEAGWTIDRRTRYRGMSKDQARDKFKAEFAQKMQAQASSPEAAARATAMRNRAGASGTVSGALKSVLEDMKAQDQRLEDLQQQTIELRKQAEEQFGGQGGEDPSMGGRRPRRRLGGGRRRDAAVDILEARLDALRANCTPLNG